MKEMQELLMMPEVGSVVLHMWSFGMTSRDKDGEAPVKKGIRVMSSSEEVLKGWAEDAATTKEEFDTGTCISYRAGPRLPKFTRQS